MNKATDCYIIKGVLANYGYCIKKAQFSPVAIDAIKTYFNVKPKLMYEDEEPDKQEDNAFDVYFEDDTYLVIPKFFSNSFLKIEFLDDKTKIKYNKISFAINKIQYKGSATNFKFTGKLRDYQFVIINSILKNFGLECKDDLLVEIDKELRPKGGIIQLSTGAGKTVLAIYLAHILKLKTLIIVHQEFLQDQWIERFNMFTNAKIGTIRGTIIDTENKDVVIGMLQSISIKDYEDSVFKDFGLVIYDEVHHFGSRVFSRALLKTSAKYNIGLSATPERLDGLIKVVKWFTGDILYKMEKKYDYKVLVKKLYFRSNDETYKEKKNWIKGQIRPNHIKMTENLMNNKTRNRLMIKAIDCLRSMGRTIFVISSRVEHLQILKNGVDLLIAEAKEQHIYNTYYYIGPTKKGEKKMAEKDGNIIFATIQLASEALDIPRLDTIVLALPIKQDKTLIQSIGRILRNDKLESLTQIPVVVDISDILSIYQKWSEKRNSVYTRKNWFVQNYYWEDESYLYRGKEDKNLKPMNIIFDDIEDEDFIEKNLIIKPEDIIKEKEIVLDDDETSSKSEKKTSSLKMKTLVDNVKPQYVFKGKKYT